jgi:hypothetical protein
MMCALGRDDADSYTLDRATGELFAAPPYVHVTWAKSIDRKTGARTIEIKASHVSLISNPDVIAKLILEAAGRSRAEPLPKDDD